MNSLKKSPATNTLFVKNTALNSLDKTSLTLLMLLFLSTISIAQTTYVPDNNFEAYLETNSMGNGIANDDYVTTANISSVTHLYVDSKNISDLTGIAGFTSLTNLQCQTNQLTTLDLSQNTALVSLQCQSNQLTAINVTQNTGLTNFHCYDNQLTTLDVTQNTALTNLGCYYNQLTTLDVTQNTALISLICVYNQLTTLDVTQNTALSALTCYYNQLTTLDVTQNTGLTSLNCGYNLLTALDVTHNTALTHLYTQNSQLTALDVTQNTALTLLYCMDNQLTNLNIANGNNANMTIMHAHNNNLTCIQVDDESNTPPTGQDWQKDTEASYDNNCPDVGYEEFVQKLDFSMYPNPTTNTLNIEAKNKIYKISIYNLLGQEVMQKSVANSFTTLDLSKLPAGAYIVKVYTDKQAGSCNLLKQ